MGWRLNSKTARLALFSGLLLLLLGKTLPLSAQPGPQSGGVSLNGSVTGPPPANPAVIAEPVSGQLFRSFLIRVSGSCPSNNIVEIYKNDILAGSTLCVDSQFSLKIDLVIGLNKLVARVRDNLSQYGPDSKVVTVTYTPVGPAAGKIPGPIEPPQLLIISESQYFGAPINQTYRLHLTITGGSPPYAVSIDWGDKQQSLIARAVADSFDAEHVYHSKAVFYVIAKASDNLAASAYSQTVIITRLSLLPAAKKAGLPVKVGTFLVRIWPLYAMVLCFLAGFGLGVKLTEGEITKLWKTNKFRRKRLR